MQFSKTKQRKYSSASDLDFFKNLLYTFQKHKNYLGILNKSLTHLQKKKYLIFFKLKGKSHESTNCELSYNLNGIKMNIFVLTLQNSIFKIWYKEKTISVVRKYMHFNFTFQFYYLFF